MPDADAGCKCRAARLPTLLLTVFLAAKYAVILGCPLGNAWGGDEGDYARKAMALWEMGTFPAIQRVPEGALGYPDFRPVGYSAVVAPFMALGPRVSHVRAAVRGFHVVFDLAATLLLWHIVCSFLTALSVQMATALAIGCQPWTCQWVSGYGPDALVTSLLVFGVYALSRFVVCVEPRSVWAWLLAGSTLVSVTLTMRPEMAAMAPAVVAVPVILRRPLGWGRLCRFGAVAALPYVLSTLACIAYRLHYANEISVYGSFHHATPGLLTWSRTWNAPFRVKSEVLWGVDDGAEWYSRLPDGAFDSDTERDRVCSLMVRMRNRGGMQPEDDDEFSQIAAERMGRNPLRYYAWVPLYESLHLWLNLETSVEYLTLFSTLPRLLSKLLVGGFLLLRLTLLGLAVIGAVRLCAEFPGRPVALHHAFLAIGCVAAVLRTLFFGFYVVTAEFRYVSPVWPFVIVAGLYGFAWLWYWPKVGSVPSPDRAFPKSL